MLTFLSANILSLANERWLRQLDAVVIISVNTKDWEEENKCTLPPNPVLRGWIIRNWRLCSCLNLVPVCSLIELLFLCCPVGS